MEMLTDETDELGDVLDDLTGGRCGATTRDGTPCRRWLVGSAGEGRCRFHGGASTGPDEPATDHLEDNDHAVDNDGGAPEGNANAEIHGGFADWKKAYRRFDDETQEYVDRIAADWRETAAEHAPDVDADRRAELSREHATLSILHRRTSADTVAVPDGSRPGRGFILTEERDIGGETHTVRKANPALRAGSSLSRRQREIAKDLRLYPGLQGDE
jgi:hypothetical protein